MQSLLSTAVKMSKLYFMVSVSFATISLALKMCPESISTVSTVNRCPSNVAEWESAAKKKSCNDLGQLQSCTAADDFVYHCVLNKDATMLLEVCAPTYLMPGYCARFSEVEKRIIIDTGLDCTKFDPPCSSSFLSNESYKNQMCYRNAGVNLNNCGVSQEKNVHVVTAIVTFTIIVLLLLIVFGVAYKLQMIKFFCRKNSGEQSGIGVFIMASDPPCPQKPYKVWNFDKTEGRIMAASKLEELQLKAKTKFDISTNIKLVLEDGCIIDDEEAFQMLQGSISEVFCLKEGESLSFAGPSSQSSPSAGNTSHLLHLVQRIRNKQTSLHSQPKRRKSTINLNFGWMVFDETSSKFCQIRSPRGGGTRIMEMRLNSTYDDLLEIGKSTFFPNGVSHLGMVEEYNHEVGDFCGKAITAQAENFTLENYVLNLKMTTKPRLYLLSKKKVQEQEEESNESWELPDIPEIISNHPTLEEPDIPAIPDHLLTDQASGDMAQAIASPVTIRMPQMPTCTVCTERFSDTFFIPCGHIACTVCAAELEERGQQCHICRGIFTSTSKLYF